VTGVQTCALPICGRKAKLEGLIANVPAGHAFFPTSTIAEIVFDPPAAGDK